MNRLLLLAVMAGSLPALAAMAQAPAERPDLAKTQTIVKDVCSACHGIDGNSAIPANPSVAGQPAEYISLQLAHFQAG